MVVEKNTKNVVANKLPFYIDIHAHHLPITPSNDVLTVLNRQPSDPIPITSNNNVYHSVGWHPWWVNEQPPIDWNDFALQIQQNHTILVGECGLDSLRGAPLAVQIPIFEQHIRLAQKYQKPIIVHCVRAWNELISLSHSISNNTIPMIIHGFVAKPTILQMLLSANYYVSFGTALLRSNPVLHHSFRTMPADKLFLETDDSHIPIQEIYQTAAAIRQISVEELSDILHQNWSNLLCSRI